MNLALFTLIGLLPLACVNHKEVAKNDTSIEKDKLEFVSPVQENPLITSSEDTIAQMEEIDARGIEVVVQEKAKLIKEVSIKKKTPENYLLPEHSPWSILLIKYVDDKGDVDYRAFQNDSVALGEYLNHLEKNSPKKDWPKNEKLAYYINLYNAATVKLILDNYPTTSIRNIKNPWGMDWVKTGDGVLSLGDIEHKILRKMNEPRIHFAINCASFSCPKLLNKAFTAAEIEIQLHEATLDFVNDKTRNIISKEEMQLSNIFKWYKKDFTENGSLTDYIKTYTTIEINSDTDIDYLKYDWNLNETK